MARVFGIGGVFFKSPDPAALKKWYIDHLDFPDSDDPGVTFKNADLPNDSFQVFAPFQADTQYFDPAKKDFMLNLVVDNVEGVNEKATKGGGTAVGEIEEYDFGRFGWFMDPDGNKIELWQPPESE